MNWLEFSKEIYRTHMSNHFLNMGELVATSQASNISCFGLGSCVGLFLYDRLSKVGAGAHIVLSGDLERESTYNAYTAFEEMLEKISELGGDLGSLRAKMVGGASLFNSGLNIGERNVKAISQLLLEHKIYVAAKEVGGSVSRSVVFSTKDGSLKISTPNQKYTI